MITYKKLKLPWWRFWYTRDEKRTIEYRRGYTWALQQILTGARIQDMQAVQDAATKNNTYTMFNAGIHTAIHRLTKIKK